MMASDGEGPRLDITRRDFVNTTLIGAGAALLGAGCPARAQTLGAEWTGPGGVGEYRLSNGNTADTVASAHRIRDQLYAGALHDVIDTGERYDLIVVGGGFGGLGALHAFKEAWPRGSALLLDNQEIVGGYAKANAFDVDGVRIEGAQASMNFVLPTTDQARADSYWDALGLPDSFRFARRDGGDPAIRFQRSTSGTLYHGEQAATMGYFSGPSPAAPNSWVKDVWAGDLATAPWPEATRAGLLKLRDLKRRGRPTGDEARRLDGMTFADYAVRELGIGPDVLSYVTLGMCQTGPQISALAAMTLPGIDRYSADSPEAALADRFIGFPGGNAVIARYFVRAIVPDAFAGATTLEGIAHGPMNAAALDRAGAPFRLRSRATVVRVEHDGDPRAATGVIVTYEKGGRLHRVRAKAAVTAIGQWVAKHVVAGLPAAHRAAMDRFLYAPMLIVNVALRNWRFLDRLGVSAMRWFGGFGFYASIRQPMVVGDAAPPFGPDHPIVLTMYVPYPNPELPIEAQGPAGRAQLFGTSYADYEKQIVDQLTRLFAAGGFDARRDIAGIVLNRWGHAFVTAGPGFLLGQDGAPPPPAAVQQPFGRIAFGPHGMEDWLGAAHAGKRAVADLAHALA